MKSLQKATLDLNQIFLWQIFNSLIFLCKFAIVCEKTIFTERLGPCFSEVLEYLTNVKKG